MSVNMLSIWGPNSSGNESPEQIIHRLAYALADVRSKLTSAGGEAHYANHRRHSVSMLAEQHLEMAEPGSANK
jgi:hypothetical protein